MAFVVNSADWQFNGLEAAQIERYIENALEFVEISRERAERVYIGDDLQTRAVYGTSTLWDLFDPQCPVRLSGDVQQELAGWLGRADYYADSEDWPEGADETTITLNGTAIDNPDIAWVHHCVRSGGALAVLVFKDAGKFETVSSCGSVVIHLIDCEVARIKFWREQLEQSTADVRVVEYYAPHAYPQVHFAGEVVRSLDDLAGGYAASRSLVQDAFAALNDWGAWAFTASPPAMTPLEQVDEVQGGARPSDFLIQRRFAGIGLVAAPEHADVAADPVCRKARTLKIGVTSLYCEWHIKLEPHRNRIHIHGPTEESKNRVIVGMIAEHLPLP